MREFECAGVTVQLRLREEKGKFHGPGQPRQFRMGAVGGREVPPITNKQLAEALQRSQGLALPDLAGLLNPDLRVTTDGVPLCDLGLDQQAVRIALAGRVASEQVSQLRELGLSLQEITRQLELTPEDQRVLPIIGINLR